MTTTKTKRISWLIEQIQPCAPAPIDPCTIEDPLERALFSGPRISFRTFDLDFAAYLAISGVPLRGTAVDSRSGRPRVAFLFDDSVQIEDLHRRRWTTDARVSARAFAAVLARMRDLRFETLRPDDDAKERGVK